MLEAVDIPECDDHARRAYPHSRALVSQTIHVKSETSLDKPLTYALNHAYQHRWGYSESGVGQTSRVIFRTAKLAKMSFSYRVGENVKDYSYWGMKSIFVSSYKSSINRVHKKLNAITRPEDLICNWTRTVLSRLASICWDHPEVLMNAHPRATHLRAKPEHPFQTKRAAE